MTFNTALSAAQQTKLRSGGYAVDQRVSLFSNRVVFECQVNVDLTLGVVFAAFTWNNTLIGAYTNVEVGQTIWVSPVNDITKWIWRGRVRLAPGAATIYCNETQANWAVGYYVFVTDTFEVWDRLSRPTADVPPQQRVDFDETYHLMRPGIQGLQYVYAGAADPVSGKFRIALNLTGVAYESGSSISSWLITPRAGQATLVSGSYSSAVATFDLDPTTMSTWGETWFTVTVTDLNSNTLTRHCGVKITNASHPADLNFTNVDITADIARGWSARCPAFSGVDSVLPWTLTVVWRAQEQFNNVVGALGALSNIDFIGYLRKDDPKVSGDAHYGVLSDTTFELVDVAHRMASTEMQLLGIFNDTTAAWDHINNATIQRAIWHCLTNHSTVATLVDVAWDTFLSDNRYLFPDFSTQGQNLLSAMNGIAAQVNAALEFGPDGAIEVNRDLRQTNAATRSAAVTVASFNANGGGSDDCIVIGSSRTYEPKIGVLDANGAGNVVPPVYQSRAPGLAQGISQGKGTLANQILAQPATGLATQTEINQRGGNQFEIENEQETLTCDFDGGYGTFMIPSRAQWFTFATSTNLAGPGGINRIIYDTSIRWQLESIHSTTDNLRGARKVTATFRRESPIGLPGYSVIIPPQPTATVLPFPTIPPAFGIDPIILPPLGIITPPIDPLPTKPAGVTPTVDWTASQAWISINYPGMVTPTRWEITPTTLGAFAIQHVIADLADLSVKTTPVYLLASDGTNSAVWYTKDALQKPPVWTQGANVTGVFKLIRLTQTPGSIEIYTPQGVTGAAYTYDFSTGQQGWVISTNGGSNNGVYVSGAGFQTADVTISPTADRIAAIDLHSPPANITSISVLLDYQQGITDDVNQPTVNLIGFTLWRFGGAGPVFPNGSNEFANWSGAAQSPSVLSLAVRTDYSGGGSFVGFSGSATIRKVYLNGSVTGAQSALSTNYGATFATPVTVGSPGPGASGGFDVQHGGTVSFAASDQNINKATTLGGAYSAFLATTGAEPIVILLPWWKWGQSTSGTKNTGTTPDFIYGTSAAISGETLWCVVGSTATAVSPKIAGAAGVPVGPNCLTTWAGTRIAGLFNFSGTVHLMTGVITNPGTPAITWTDQGALAGTYIRGAYFAKVANPLFIAGAAAEWYSANYGASVNTRTPPTGTLLGLEPCG